LHFIRKRTQYGQKIFELFIGATEGDKYSLKEF